jgi:hypothetical protein
MMGWISLPLAILSIVSTVIYIPSREFSYPFISEFAIWWLFLAYAILFIEWRRGPRARLDLR